MGFKDIDNDGKLRIPEVESVTLEQPKLVLQLAGECYEVDEEKLAKYLLEKGLIKKHGK